MRNYARPTWLIFLCGVAVLGAPAGDSDEFTRAMQCYRAQAFAEAREIFSRLAGREPGKVEIDFHLGRLALWFDEGELALTHLERALRTAPGEARIHNALGDAYGSAAQNAHLLAKLGWARKCRAAYERAVELDPANPAYRWSLVGYFCVAPRLAGGGLEKARAQAGEIARLDPMEGRTARATLALAEQNWEAAFAEFDPVLREMPDNFLALYQVGRCAALSGRQIERGIAALRRCLELTAPAGENLPTFACVHFRLGNLLEKKGDPTAAAEYAAARRAHPDFRPQKITLKM